MFSHLSEWSTLGCEKVFFQGCSEYGREIVNYLFWKNADEGRGCDDVTMVMKFCEKFPLFCRLSAFIALGVTLILANQKAV